MSNDDIGRLLISYGATVAAVAIVEDVATSKHMTTNERIYQTGISIAIIGLAIAIFPLKALKGHSSTWN